MPPLSDSDLLFQAAPETFEAALDTVIEHSLAELHELESEARKTGRTPPNLVPRMEALLTPAYRLNGYLTVLDILDSRRFCKARATASGKLTRLEGYVLGSRELARCLAQEIIEDRYLKPGAAGRLFQNPTISDWAYLNRFERRMRDHGAYLDSADQQKDVLALHQKLNRACNKYMANIQGGQEQQALLYTDEAYLEGVPPARKKAYQRKAAEVAELLRQEPNGKWSRFAERLAKADKDHTWIVMPERMEVEALLPVARHPEFRLDLANAYNAVGLDKPFNNMPLAKKLLAYRQKLADLLSAPSYRPKNYTDLITKHSPLYHTADLTPNHVQSPSGFIDAVLAEGLPRYSRDVKTITRFAAILARQTGDRRFTGRLDNHNFLYYAQKYYEAKGFDDEVLSRYMGVETILANLSIVLEKDFDVLLIEDRESETRFAEERGYEGLKVYKVLKTVDGKKIELKTKLCFDLFSRPGKKDLGWAAYVPGMAFVVMNLNKSERGQTLLTLSEYVALFHELGHCLGSCLSDNGDPREFLADVERVETFSGILEFRAPSYLKDIARLPQHPDQLPPKHLLQHTLDYCTFLQRHQTMRRAYIGWRDLHMHAIWVGGKMKYEEERGGWSALRWYRHWFGTDSMKQISAKQFFEAIDSSIQWPDGHGAAIHSSLSSCLFPFALNNWLHFATQSPPYAAGFYSYLLGPVIWANLETYGEQKKARTKQFYEDAFGTIPTLSFLNNFKLIPFMTALGFYDKEITPAALDMSSRWQEHPSITRSSQSTSRRS